jgi:hypothetical protein
LVDNILCPSKDEMQLQLMNDKSATAGAKGGAALMGQGLKIEDLQYVESMSMLSAQS